MSNSIRTPLAKVRGLGSAKAGVGHFIVQRATAVAAVFLVPWFLISLIGAVRGGWNHAMMWAAQPFNAILTIVALGAVALHMRAGMQVVIEDYIHRPATKIVLLLLNTFVSILLFAAGAFAALVIAG